MEMKIVVALLCLLLLTGCTAQETFETVGDWYYEPAISEGVISLSIPEQAAVTASGSEGTVYLCEGYTVCLQTLQAGDLDRTLQSVSGFSKEQLQLVSTQPDGVIRYDFVWAAAGEGGDQLCRGAILDDGAYHYVLTVMAEAAEAKQCAQTWNALFASFSVSADD